MSRFSLGRDYLGAPDEWAVIGILRLEKPEDSRRFGESSSASAILAG